MSVVPITVREHLVPFFFKESEGKEYVYGNKKVKAVVFSSSVSTVGRIIRLLMVKTGTPLNIDYFNLCLTITDAVNGKRYQGQFYKNISGRSSFLALPKDANDDINDLLEDIFRMAFFSYVQGCIENNDEAIVVNAINKFIDKYDLLEFGFSNDTLRRLYYREKKNNKLISRYQNKKTNRILNYA
jgi:hypothetical protein